MTEQSCISKLGKLVKIEKRRLHMLGPSELLCCFNNYTLTKEKSENYPVKCQNVIRTCVNLENDFLFCF